MSVLGIDIGGTKTIVAIASEDAKIIAQERIDTPREQGPSAVLAAIVGSVRSLLTCHESCVTAVGIGCGGPLDRERGAILFAPNLPGWENLDLVGHFSNAFRAPVSIDNDVNLMALGEAREGAGVGIDHIAYFNIGTGVGGGIVIGGDLYRGCGNAAEFGHQIILPDGPDCLCGKRGCLEALASGTSIARRAKERLADRPDSLILTIAGSLENVTARTIADAAAEGDDLALRIWRETGECLGIGVANVVNILNPRMVILGGGVTEVGDLLLDPVRHTVRERAMAQLADDVRIVRGTLGDQAGIIGAIHLAMECD